MNERPSSPPPRLSLLVSPSAEGARIYAPPAQLPRSLRPFFNRHGEAFPVPLLDLDDLREVLGRRNARVEVQESPRGTVTLRAQGSEVVHLVRWLGTALQSGLRSAPEETEPAR